MKHFLRILFNVAVVQSLILGVVTAVFWVRSYSGNDYVVWQYRDFVPWQHLSEIVHEKSFSLHLFSGQGGFAVDVILKDHDIYHPWEAQDLGLSQTTYHSSPPQYPKPPADTRSWEWRGFGCSLPSLPSPPPDEEPKDPWQGVTSRLVGVGRVADPVVMQICFPAWFAMLLCMILPSVWLVRKVRARRGMVAPRPV